MKILNWIKHLVDPPTPKELRVLEKEVRNLKKQLRSLDSEILRTKVALKKSEAKEVRLLKKKSNIKKSIPPSSW